MIGKDIIKDIEAMTKSEGWWDRALATATLGLLKESYCAQKENKQLTERIKVLEGERENLIDLMKQVAADPTAKGPMAAMQNAIDYYKALEDK